MFTTDTIATLMHLIPAILSFPLSCAYSPLYLSSPYPVSLSVGLSCTSNSLHFCLECM